MYLGISLVLFALFIILVKPQEHTILFSLIFIILSSIVQFSLAYYGKMDTEILSGYVTKKYSEKVLCEHSYDCNCHNVKRGSSYNRECSTCYEHLYDVSWVVESTVGNTYIDRVNRQGTTTPPRFTSVSLGEPFATTHSFYNHVKKSKNSLFYNEPTKDVSEYPETIYDYYKINRVVNEDKTIPASLETILNNELSEQLKTVGTNKQVNVVLYFTKKPESYGIEVKKAWLGGKKNDVVVVIGSNDGKNIDWNHVFGWSKHDTLNISIRNELYDHKNIDGDMLNIIFTNINKFWVRNEMSNFAYLEEENDLDISVIICMIYINIIGVVLVNHIVNNQMKGMR